MKASLPWILTILILAAVLVYQMRERRAAEASLAAALASTSHNLASSSPSTAVSGDLVGSLDTAIRENALMREAAKQARSDESDPTTAKVAVLKDVLSRLPEQAIPELQFATTGDWYSAVDGPLETTDDYRKALGKLRSSAEKRFAALAQPALRAYLDAHKDEFPRDVSQLMPYFDPTVGPSVLQRYRVVPASEVRSVGVGGAYAITQKSLIDSDYDSRTVIGPRGFGAFSKR